MEGGLFYETKFRNSSRVNPHRLWIQKSLGE